MGKKWAAVTVAVLLSLAAVGCGSSKKDDSASTDAAGAEKQSQDNGSTTTTGKSDGSTTTTDSGSGAINSLNDLTNGNLGDCLSVSAAYAKLVLEPLSFSGGATQEQIDQFEKDTQDVEAKIPSDLKDDFKTVADAYKDYADALKGIDLSNPGPDMLKLQEAGAKLDSPDVKAAQANIQSYFDDNCGK